MVNTSTDGELRRGVVVVSHDASRTGAPLIALNIARELAVHRGLPVVTILLASGELAPEFARLGPLFVAGPARATPDFDPRHLRRLAKRAVASIRYGSDEYFWWRISKFLIDRRIKYGFCNTVLSGRAAMRLQRAGVSSLGLVHELPYTIHAYGWTEQAHALIEGSVGLVFPCHWVHDTFTTAFSATGKPNFILPQGLDTNSYLVQAESHTARRSSFRARLNLSPDDILVLGCGTGDFRKGIDLFVQTARQNALALPSARSGDLVFAWAGPVIPDFQIWAERDLTELRLTGRFQFLGPQDDVALCLAASDIFFLSSREDPFPNAVLEAMASGLPVIGFAGSGGVEEQVRQGAGVTVPYCDIAAVVRIVRELAERPDQRNAMGRAGREKMAASEGSSAYVDKLIEALWAAAAASPVPFVNRARDSDATV